MKSLKSFSLFIMLMGISILVCTQTLKAQYLTREESISLVNAANRKLGLLARESGYFLYTHDTSIVVSKGFQIMVPSHLIFYAVVEENFLGEIYRGSCEFDISKDEKDNTLNYEIDNCIHKNVFPQKQTGSWGIVEPKLVVVSGSIPLN